VKIANAESAKSASKGCSAAVESKMKTLLLAGVAALFLANGDSAG
jgi:hypothetical protein